jgi:Holliday junction resolvasome RuvABC DNA-binding subunit
MILELKSKVSGLEWSSHDIELKGQPLPSDPNSATNQAIEALLVLGYDLREATKQVRLAVERHPDAKVEVLIKDALQMLLRI